MALRALGLNLTRRLFSRGNAHAQAVLSQRIVPQAASLSSSDRAVRSFYTFRDPEIVGGGGGTVTAGVAAFVGLIGILFVKERSDGSSGGVTHEEVLGKKPVTINEEVKPVTINEELPGKKPVTLSEEPTYEGSLLWGAKISRAELEHDRRYREMRRKKECN